MPPIAPHDYLQMPCKCRCTGLTPEAFIDLEHTYPQHALDVAVSQSGYSTNTIAALDYMRAHDMAAVALTANVEAPIKGTLTSFLTTVWASSRWTL